MLLAAAVMVGGIFVATATMGTGTSVGLVSSAYADANCDKANLERNDQNNVRGNPKQCISLPFNTEGEQPRSCLSPNFFKDNDGDGNAYCINRR